MTTRKTEIYFESDEMRNEIDEGSVLSFIENASRALGLEGNFSLSFISDDEMRRLNNEYRNMDSSTDVLTFALDDDASFPSFDFEEKELGDIFISPSFIRKNSEEFSVPYSQELMRLVLHGMMHLMGYDHESNDFEKEEMLIKQEEILRAILLDKSLMQQK
ncbi:MAG TPA: rRNA maturation RNase YbeY [Candidatus Ornithospirochaeta avicola]|uniref:Endoribonuclease YbeY n=1 Tax=Candidatus Ornithospirochaeta avicola TaxID=2840896 RepID=A0A9D1TM63_9SPIO|nr:rRNA maturation RNase YbeY [Candidatus Ornithospirochaeta avicola]